MEKFNSFARLTKEFLQGTMSKLEIQYEDDNSVLLKVLYEDTNQYRYDYEMHIDLLQHLVDYATHLSKGYLSRVELSREQAFEQAITNAFFSPSIA